MKDQEFSVETAKKHFNETITTMQSSANRLTELVESRKITVPEYKRRMWEHLGISPHCIKEGVSYVIQPESNQP